MKNKNLNLIVAGVGGQGILRTDQILCNAAMNQGYDVYCFEEHGMAQRGGSVASFIRFGKDIYTPFMLEGRANLLVAFEPVEALRPLRFMNNKGLAIINTRPIIPVSVSSNKDIEYPEMEKIRTSLNENLEKVVYFDATYLAEKAGSAITMNAVMLGAISASGLLEIPKERFMESIMDRVPRKAFEMNQKAFDLGCQAFVDNK
jgi:indolepyruvate ferredoxin oxidoreductase beta subunit